MTTRFLLIKHLSLGFGVLLKRENADVGKIYFAETRAAKSVILSHPYLSVAEGLTLSKFVSLGLYEGLFDEQTKEKGREYLENHIKDMHVAENECYGSIMGSHEYQFRISVDQNSFINIPSLAYRSALTSFLTFLSSMVLSVSSILFFTRLFNSVWKASELSCIMSPDMA